LKAGASYFTDAPVQRVLLDDNSWNEGCMPEASPQFNEQLKEAFGRMQWATP